MAGIYDFIREEYEKAKKAFGLIENKLHKQEEIEEEEAAA